MFTKNSRAAFTLVEILLSVVLASAVGLVVVQATRQALLFTTSLSNHSLAWERGQNVLSILDSRVSHAAFGIAYDRGDTFQRSFGGSKSSSPPPGRWLRGPVQIWQGGLSLTGIAEEEKGVCRGRALAVLYAVPSALKAVLPDNRPLPMDENTVATIKLAPKENLDKIADRLKAGTKNDLWSWATFPLMQLPVHAAQYFGGELTVRLAENSGLSATLFPYDELHYLRGERFQVQQRNLYVEELRNAWVSFQPWVEGVLEMWFEWTPSKRLLDAWVLTTGGPSTFGKSSRPPDWPAEAPWRAEFEAQDFSVCRGSWLLRNVKSKF